MTTRAVLNEQRDQKILIATLIGVAIAVIGLGYQMALPDPNPVIGCAIMFVGVLILLWALYQSTWKSIYKILVSIALLTADLVPSFYLLTARAIFEPHVVSAIISISPSSGERIQLWADVENIGDRAGLIKSWHLTLILPDGRIKEGRSMYGQQAKNADGQLWNADSLEDKTENSAILRHAHPKGFLFFFFDQSVGDAAKDDRTALDLWLVDDQGRSFHAKQKTVADIRNDVPD